MSVDFLSKNFPPFQVHHAKKPPRFYPDGFQRNVIDFYFIFSDCRLRKALYLQFSYFIWPLRNADGIDDINASTTQQEYIDKYIAKKYGYLEKKSEHQDDDKNESRQNDMTIESQQDSKKIKKIDEGYQKIYQTYIKETDAEYRKDYNAKGYSYIVTYEDETQIRYLMYDRDNQEGTKTQYVYYKNIKSTDGSWSMMDAEILDMYQYDYESKEVKDLQKTSW